MQKTASDTDILDLIEHLETADQGHRAWLQRVHTAIICKQPFKEDVIDCEAHRHCNFGRWYYTDAPQILNERQEFIALEPLHRVMHDAARKLAQICESGQPVEVADYEDFINKQSAFSSALLALRDDLNELLHSFDALTGLMTRQPFAQILESEYARLARTGARSSMALMDIDHFKRINDQYGHLAGDRVLRHIAQFVRSHIRPYDSVCRYGGEEFLVVLPDTHSQTAFEIIDRLRQQIALEDIEYSKGRTLRLTVSAGIAELSDESEKTTIGQADKALYHAKNAGRNRVCCIDCLNGCELSADA